MYTTVRSKDFLKALAKIRKQGLAPKLQAKLDAAILLLAAGEKLPTYYKDHRLKGVQAANRECHIGGDLLLVYRIEHGELLLLLLDIGSHAHIFE
jgi:mRNA interferase YafQ